MQTVTSIIPLLAVLVSIAVVPFLAICRWPNVREGFTFLAGGIKLLLVASLVPLVLAGQEVVCQVVEVMPGVAIAFRVDALGLIFALVAASLWIATSAYSIGYMRGLSEHSQTRYYCFFALALSATIGVAFAANLLTLYLFYEMLSLATWPLVTHHQDREARSSGRKYLFYIVGSSIGLLLPAILITYSVAGTGEFAATGVLAGKAPAWLVLVLMLMYLFGLAKAGVMPMHSWLPAAMVAPTPVSALLHAVAVVKVGVFSIVRVLTGIFGVGLLADLDLGLVLGYIASFTVIVASLIALSQDELKRRLAFSTIGQLAYIILGLALLVPLGLRGGVLHIVMHAFGKITLFFCAGAIFVATGRKYISQMNGLGRRMPVTLTAFLVGSLSVIGLPPAGGFISKWFLLLGTLDAHRTVFMVVLLFSSLLNAAYFLPIVYRGFFSPATEPEFQVGFREAPTWCVAPLVITALCSLLLFFYPEPFLALTRLAVAKMTGG